MYAAYDGIGIIIRNNLHKRHHIFSDLSSVRTVNFTCDVYTNDSLHGVCFPTVSLVVLNLSTVSLCMRGFKQGFYYKGGPPVQGF